MSNVSSINPARKSNLRWWICGLLFLATTINYLDRQTLSVLKPLLQKDLGWDEAQYGWINFSFQAAYALMYSISGRLADLIGSKAGLALGVAVWSLAAMAHALVRSPVGFGVARFFLGAGESMNFPASLKVVAEWFPENERALASGIFNSGSNMGIVFGVVAVWMASRFHWQAAFVVTGILGLLWLLLWIRYYPSNGPSSATKRSATGDEAKSPPGTRHTVRWTALLRYRQAWAFLISKFLTDPVWWFYLYWLPDYLHKARGLPLLDSAGWLAIPYIAADVGSIGGGWLSGALIKRGWNTGKARYAAMALCAICMPGAIVAVKCRSLALALLLISLATAAHQGWSANLFTTATDLFPAEMAGSVVGLGGACGAIGGTLMTLLVGGLLQWQGSFTLIFIWAGLMHPLSWVLFWLIAGPNMSRAELRSDVDAHASPALLAGGAAAVAVGAMGTFYLISRWNFLLHITKASAIAGGITTTVGIALIGLALVYAGFAKRTPGSSSR